MKPDKIQTKNAGCTADHCLSCVDCSQVNYEEIRSVKPEAKHTSADLYAAEAQHYYFYFPSNDRAV
jgi:hypothetical protein